MWPRRTVITSAAMAFAGSVVAIVSACSYDWSFTPAGGSDAQPDMGLSDAAVGVDVVDASDGSIASQGCRGNGECGSGICRSPDGLCGTGLPATCVARRTGCSEVEPVCGCSGIAHNNPCTADTLGDDTNDRATCPAPPGGDYFSCGYRFCRRKAEFCQVTSSGARSCRSLEGCATVECACAAVVSTTCGCKVRESGAVLDVTCP